MPRRVGWRRRRSVLLKRSLALVLPAAASSRSHRAQCSRRKDTYRRFTVAGRCRKRPDRTGTEGRFGCQERSAQAVTALPGYDPLWPRPPRRFSFGPGSARNGHWFAMRRSSTIVQSTPWVVSLGGHIRPGRPVDGQPGQQCINVFNRDGLDQVGIEAGFRGAATVVLLAPSRQRHQ
jgi:hypothetical protein